MSFLTNSKSTIKVFACILLVAPIACNFIIGTQRFSNLPVIGDEKLWLQFFGSYMGSALAVIGALFVCYQTIDENKKAQKSDFRHREILEIQRELATRLEKYSPDEILPCSIAESSNYPDPEKVREEMDRLQTLYCKCDRLFHSATLLYLDYREPKSKEFLESYKQLMESSKVIITMLLNAYKKENEADWLTNVKLINARIDDLVRVYDVAGSKAYAFILHLIEEFAEQNKETI